MESNDVVEIVACLSKKYVLDTYSIFLNNPGKPDFKFHMAFLVNSLNWFNLGLFSV